MSIPYRPFVCLFVFSSPPRTSVSLNIQEKSINAIQSFTAFQSYKGERLTSSLRSHSSHFACAMLKLAADFPKEAVKYIVKGERKGG